MNWDQIKRDLLSHVMKNVMADRVKLKFKYRIGENTPNPWTMVLSQMLLSKPLNQDDFESTT